MHLTLPADYPFKPPSVNFVTKIYHPNISNDSPPNNGAMCLGMLKPDQWKPSTKITAVLEFTRQLLKEPNPDDAVETTIAEQYKVDREGWEREAREWTKRYAKK
jgi:ubiquitin-protein ligase